MNDLKTQTVLERAIPKLCEHLNSFLTAEFADDRLSPADYKPEWQNLRAVICQPYESTLYIFGVSIGDEGGYATLYVWADVSIDCTQRAHVILRHITYMFDGIISTVYETKPEAI